MFTISVHVWENWFLLANCQQTATILLFCFFKIVWTNIETIKISRQALLTFYSDSNMHLAENCCGNPRNVNYVLEIEWNRSNWMASKKWMKARRVDAAIAVSSNPFSSIPIKKETASFCHVFLFVDRLSTDFLKHWCMRTDSHTCPLDSKSDR